MRWWVFVLVVAGCSQRSSVPPPLPSLQTTPAVQPVKRGSLDYANARKVFATELRERGPSPQAHRSESVAADAEEVVYVSGDLRLRAWLSRTDKRGAKQPAVLFLHGGFAFGSDDWELTRPFRDAGFIVMMPMLRGENGQPGDFTLFYDEVDDVLAAATTLAQHAAVDANRIFVTGHSAGGVLAMLAAMTSPRFRAVAAMSGPPDASVFGDDVPFDPARGEEIRLRSPLAFATSFQCPARLYVGAEEELFVESTAETAKLAKATGLDVDAIEVPGDHLTMLDAAIPKAVAYFTSLE